MAVKHDLAKGAPETATRALERKVGYAVSAWTLMWLSLECSILSVANHINKPKGAARGALEAASTRKHKSESTTQAPRKRHQGAPTGAHRDASAGRLTARSNNRRAQNAAAQNKTFDSND